VDCVVVQMPPVGVFVQNRTRRIAGNRRSASSIEGKTAPPKQAVREAGSPPSRPPPRAGFFYRIQHHGIGINSIWTFTNCRLTGFG